MTSAPQEALVSSSTAPMPPVVDFTWKSPDGLTLSGCEWPSAKPDSEGAASPIPVLCLPGLSRNTRDFNEIARFLQTCGHRVIALDYRGRGKSDWDPDWRNYALTVEDKDIDVAIAELGLDRFAVLGTSRGGLHALAMGLRYPASRMAAVIFNDIGPHIEMRAIHRIAATLGHHMKCASHEDVAAKLKHTLGYQFPAFGKADWLKLAGQLASEQDGHVMMDYDPALAHQLASLDDATPTPDLWPLTKADRQTGSGASRRTFGSAEPGNMSAYDGQPPECHSKNHSRPRACPCSVGWRDAQDDFGFLKSV